MKKLITTISLSVICWGMNAQIVYNDSVTMNKDLHVREKLTVDQFVVLKNDLKVKENFRVNGNTVLDGNLKLINLNTPTNLNNKEVLFVNENGVVQKKDLLALKMNFYTPLCFDAIDPVTGNPISYNPTWANGPSKLYVACPTDARVGIGTSTPRAKLDVVGTTFTQKIAMNVSPDLMQGFFHMQTTENPAVNQIFVIERPSKKLLQLNNDGLLLAREIKVDLVNWPDYVFNKEFKLKPLAEVESYIQENGHLPDVPSAKTIETDGLNLGDMDKVLMQKVEELTLYLLEQNKKMEAQEKRIAELEIQLNSKK